MSEHCCGLMGFNPMLGDTCPACNDKIPTCSFWQYCEQLSKMIGFDNVYSHITYVYPCWKNNKPLNECSKIILDKIYER